MRKGSASPVRERRAGRRLGLAAACLLAVLGIAPGVASAQLPTTDDPRVGLSAGLDNAGTAALGVDLAAHLNKPPGLFNPANPGDFAFPNSDMAFQGNYAFVGSFNGFNDLRHLEPGGARRCRTSVVCPGGQGDVSVYGNLLFMSVEETRAKKDCTLTPAADATTRFRGVRIFDISEHSAPGAGRAACRRAAARTRTRSSTDADDPATSTSTSRAPAACARRPSSPAATASNANTPTENPSQWRIEVIKVPLAAPRPRPW